MSKLCEFCRLSIREILAESLAGRLSKFQKAKERLFLLDVSGPGLSSTDPEINNKICKTMAKNNMFLDSSEKWQ